MKALFLTSLVGVLAAVGLALSSLGPVALEAYVALVATAALLLVRRVRTIPADDGRTCTCCTSTVHDPVTVVDGTVR